MARDTHERVINALADAEEKRISRIEEDKQSEAALLGLTVRLTDTEREVLTQLTHLKLPGIADLRWTKEPVALENLQRAFALLVAETTDQNNADVVRAKAAIAAALCRFVEDKHATVEVEEKKNSRLMWMVFGVLSTFWVARDSIGVVMGIRDILPLSLLSPLPFAIISFIAVTITSALLYFMELRFFRMAMKVESLDELDIAKLEADRHKMESVQKMNIALMDGSKMNTALMDSRWPDLSRRRFTALVGFAALLNEDAEKERIKYSQSYPETPVQSWTWFGVKVFGMAVGLCSDFFTYHSILVFLAPALVGTPAGIAILIFSMLGSLCIYGSLYRKSFIRSLVPHFNEYEENQKIAKNFSTRSEWELTRSYHKECFFQEGQRAHGIKRVSSVPNLQATVTIKVDPQLFLEPLNVRPLSNPEAAVPVSRLVAP